MTNISRRQFMLWQATLMAMSAPSLGAQAVRPSWGSAAPLPIKTQEIYPTAHQQRLYVAGGIAAKLGVPYFTDRCFSYDPLKDEWRDEPNLPEALHHAALVSTQQRLFLIGGFNGGYSHIWRMRDHVYELLEGGWKKVGKLPAARAEGVVSTAPDGAIHCVTGQSPHGTGNNKRSDHREVHDHWRWDVESADWQELTPIPTARNSATGAWVGDQLIVTGGRTATGNLNVTEIFDMQTGQWRTAAPLPLPQAGTASVVVDDGLIVFGGEIFTPQSKVFAEVWRYSLGADKWSALPDMPTPRHGLGAALFDNNIFVVGGATEPGGRGTSDLNEVLTL